MPSLPPGRTYLQHLPLFPRNAEILFTTEEVYAHLCSLKLQVEDDHIDYLVKRGIVGLRELEQIKRAMQTWTDYHYKRTQRSYERGSSVARKGRNFQRRP